jgi:hypothetical protein
MSPRRVFASLFRRSRKERDLDEELAFHLEALAERHRQRGLSPEAALRAARAEFGGVEGVKEEVREAWALARLSEFARDARMALRGLRKRPAYAATVVLTLALALGAAGSIWSALWAILVRPLPVADDSRLFRIAQIKASTGEVLGLSPPEIADLRGASRTLSGLVEYHSMNFTLLGHGEPRRVRVGVVSPDYFRLLGIAPIAGRDFEAADDHGDAEAVLLVSHEYWKREFGGDPAVIGAQFSMNDRAHTVIGVLPPMPALPEPLDVYMPVRACPFRAGPGWAHQRAARGLLVLGRLAPGATEEEARAELAAVGAGFAAAHPADYPASAAFAMTLSPVRQELTRGARPLLALLGSAALAVLLLVCANLLNLTVAQQQRRETEFAMRAALGGSRARLLRQRVVEATVLSSLGGALGLVLALATQGLLANVLGRLTPRADEIRFDGVTVVAVLGLSLLVGLVLGVVPSLLDAVSGVRLRLWPRRARGRRLEAASPSTDLATALRCDGSRGTTGPAADARRRFALRDVLVVVQVAASFVLLIGAGLLIGSLRNLQRVPAGFAHDDVLTIYLAHNWSKYADDASQVRYAERLLDRAREVPGVESAALADSYPLNSQLPWNRRVDVGRRAPSAAEPGPTADFRVVSPGYFATVGVRLVEGRLLTDADRDLEHPVAVVNEAFARALFGTGGPALGSGQAVVQPVAAALGREVTFANGNASWSIVGVVADVRQRGLGVEPKPELYVPMALSGMGDKRLLVRASGGAGPVRGLSAALERAIREVDPDQPIHDIRTLADARVEALAAPRATALLLTLAAVVALVIAAAGLAGLLAYSLSQRHHEFAIRLALGAGRGDIARLVLGRTGGLVAAGALVGLLGSLVLARGLDTMLYGLAAHDPATYAAVAAVLFGSALAAALPSLLRALHTQPSLALRAL